MESWGGRYPKENETKYIIIQIDFKIKIIIIKTIFAKSIEKCPEMIDSMTTFTLKPRSKSN